MRSKKFASVFLAVLLLMSNIGLALNVHYCGDKIASVSSAFSSVESPKKTDNTKKDCCCTKEDNDNPSCCKNKVVDLKKDTKDMIVKTFSFQIDAPFILIKTSELTFAKAEKAVLNSIVTEYYCSPNAPPLFKLYQQYIFYA